VRSATWSNDAPIDAAAGAHQMHTCHRRAVSSRGFVLVAPLEQPRNRYEWLDLTIRFDGSSLHRDSLACVLSTKPWEPSLHRGIFSLAVVELPTRGCPTKPRGTNPLDSRGLRRCSQASCP
jgi:hypothetical protein